MPRAVVCGGLAGLLSVGLSCSLQDLGHLTEGEAIDQMPQAGAGTVPDPSSESSGGEQDPPVVTGENLVSDPSFESGLVGWVGFGNSQLITVTNVVHSGGSALGSISRAESWMGPSYGLTALVVEGQPYSTTAWVRVSEGTQVVNVSTKTICPGPDAGPPVETYVPAGSVSADSEWRQLRGSFVAPTCGATDFRIYFEGPPQGVDIYLDDVEVVAVVE